MNQRKEECRLFERRASTMKDFCARKRVAEAELKALGQPQCRELCEAMYDKLPRELRDMVYEQILGDAFHTNQFTITDSPSACSSKGESLMWCPKPHKCAEGVCVRHFMDTSYMGRLVRNEIVEMWLTRSAYYIEYGFTDLPDLLNSDRWVIGTPAHRFIKLLYLEVKEPEAYYYRCPRPLKGLCGLEVLPLLRPAALLVLTVDLRGHYHDKQHTLNDNFERAITKVWDYVRLMKTKQVEIDVGTNDEDFEWTTLSCGGNWIDEWADELKDVS